MNRRAWITTLAGGWCSHRALSAAGAPNDAMEAAPKIIQAQVEAGVLESAVMHVEQRGETFTRAFGKAETAGADAVFLLASITKTMTAAAVMVLVDRGELRLKDPAMKYIPEFSEGARRKITIEHLLTHTSGLPDQLPENGELRRRHAPLSEFVKGAVRVPLLFAPGTEYHYQSMGILPAAEVAQRIAGTPFAEFMAAEVFRPLAMEHSALGLGRFRVQDTVRCQTEHAAPEAGGGAADARDWDWNSPYWRGLGAPWGGAHGSAGDVATFFKCFLHPDGRVLRRETAQAMIENYTPAKTARRGLGFALGPEGFGRGCSERSFGHGGSTGTLAWADPATDSVCVILTSLPSSVSGNLILKPVSDLVAGA